jgi:hypothetical protein
MPPEEHRRRDRSALKPLHEERGFSAVSVFRLGHPAMTGTRFFSASRRPRFAYNYRSLAHNKKYGIGEQNRATETSGPPRPGSPPGRLRSNSAPIKRRFSAVKP